MAFNLNSFKAQMGAGGARPSLFECRLLPPALMNANMDAAGMFSFMAKAAQIPGKTLGTIEVPYFGRKLKVPGDLTFQEVTTTVINDEGYKTRNLIENWISFIRDHEENISNAGSLSDMFGTLDIIKYQRGSTVSDRTYRLELVFPTDLQAIELGWENTDTLEEYSVTWNYSWWTVNQGASATSRDQTK